MRLLALLALAISALGQSIDYNTQVRHRPVFYGPLSSAPACSNPQVPNGFIWVATDQTPGSNLYACIGGTLRAQGGGGGGLTFTSPLVNTSGTVSCPLCVITSGTYADPSWITTLAGAKITGSIAGNSGGISGFSYTGSGHVLTTATGVPADGCATWASGNLNSTAAACGSGGSGAANYSQSFTTQTTVSLAHGAGTTAIVVACYDNASPPNLIEPASLALTDSNHATVTFSVAQTGKCVVNTSGGGGGGGSGTVTSVSQTVPAELTISGSPVTTSGILALSWSSFSGNKFLASPAGGGSGALAARALMALDLAPVLSGISPIVYTAGVISCPTCNAATISPGVTHNVPWYTGSTTLGDSGVDFFPASPAANSSISMWDAAATIGATNCVTVTSGLYLTALGQSPSNPTDCMMVNSNREFGQALVIEGGTLGVTGGGAGTGSGWQMFRGKTAGSAGIGVPATMSGNVLYMLPVAGTSGVVVDNGATTCPGMSPSAPGTCHQLALDAAYIKLTSLSATSPIAYNSSTGVISCPTCGGASFYQTLGIGGTSETQRARLNLIAGTNVTLTYADNSGTGSSDVTITASSSGATAFSAITGSTNTGQALVVGNGSTLSTTSTGQIVATSLSGTLPGSQLANPLLLTGTANSLGRVQITPDFTVSPGETPEVYMNMSTGTFPSTRGVNNYYGYRVDVADPTAHSAAFKVTNNGSGDSYYNSMTGFGTAGLTYPSGYALDMNFSVTGFGGGTPCTLGAGCQANKNFGGKGFIAYDWGYGTAITAASNANPVVFTSVAHGMVSTGSNPNPQVFIDGGRGAWAAVNNQYASTIIDVDHFSVPLDSTSLGALSGSLMFNNNPMALEVANVSGSPFHIARFENFYQGPAFVDFFAGGAGVQEAEGHRFQEISGKFDWFAGKGSSSTAWTSCSNCYQIVDTSIVPHRVILESTPGAASVLEAPQGVGIGTKLPGAPLESFVSASGTDATGGGLITSRLSDGAGNWRGGSMYSRFVSSAGLDALVFGVTGVNGKNPYADFDQARMFLYANGNLKVTGGVQFPDNTIQTTAAAPALVLYAELPSPGGCGMLINGSDETSTLATCISTAYGASPPAVIIQFPKGTVGLCNLDIQNRQNLDFEGLGEGPEFNGAASAATIFKSTCSSGTNQVIHAEGTSATMRGFTMRGIRIDGNANITTGLRLTWLTNPILEHVNIVNHTGYGLILDGTTPGNGACPTSTQFGWYDYIWIRGVGNTTGGIDMHYDPCSNQFGPHFFTFYGIYGHGLWMQGADSNIFSTVEANTSATGLTVSAFTCTSGTCTVTTPSGHNIPSSSKEGVMIYLPCSTTLSSGQCAGKPVPYTDRPLLAGNFIATYVSSTQFTISAPGTPDCSTCTAVAVYYSGVFLGPETASQTTFQNGFGQIESNTGMVRDNSLVGGIDNVVSRWGCQEIGGGDAEYCKPTGFPVVDTNGNFYNYNSATPLTLNHAQQLQWIALDGFTRIHVLNVNDDGTFNNTNLASQHNIYFYVNGVNSGALPVDGGLQLSGTISQPSCDATHRGTYWYTASGSGVKDNAQVCAKDSGNAYAWRTIY